MNIGLFTRCRNTFSIRRSSSICFPRTIRVSANVGRRIMCVAVSRMRPLCVSSELNCSRFGLI